MGAKHKFGGLDVHKDEISLAATKVSRQDEVRDCDTIRRFEKCVECVSYRSLRYSRGEMP